jgi:predicted ATPase
VRPESQPPTNIHVIIGRNGVGKTRLLQLMAHALVSGESSSDRGEFRSDDENEDGHFANLVSVSFSAFDDFEPLPMRRNKAKGLQYAYVGLKWQRDTDGKQRPPKSPEQLSKEFVASVRICRLGARSSRWLRALEMLKADPIFNDANISAMTDNPDNAGTDAALNAFRQLSSGHKIVLLTITRLVEVVEERTLVLLDEPEAHLHPPLLSALVRSLSDLMSNRNAVAIIATHSPVVLQEAPRSCVWKIRRSANTMAADRPDIETFGENVGVLTREVFGLEVTQSGFHRLLTEAVAEDGLYDVVIERFGNQLGDEARAIVRALAAERRRQRFT